MNPHPAAWLIVLEALAGGVIIAIIGGVVFYCMGLLILSAVSVILPLAGGPPKILLERRKRRER